MMITSASNAKIRQLISLQEKSRVRNREGLFVAEGLKMFEEAPADRLREVYLSSSLQEQWEREKQEEGYAEHNAERNVKSNAKCNAGRNAPLWRKLDQCREQGIRAEQVSDDVFRKISDTCTPQGILFVMEQSAYSLEEMVERALKRAGNGGRPPLFLVLEDIQDPGNLGTMLRTGEGAGVDGVIMSRGTVDIYNPKTIRSTMGSLYRVPFVCAENLEEAVGLLQSRGVAVYAAHLQGEQYFDEISYDRGSAFLVGNEGRGLGSRITELADVLLKIPMEGEVESLNAAVSAALLLYQAAGSYRKNRS